MADTVRVLIADDDPLVRVGLSLVLGAAPEIEIVGEAGDGSEAVAMVRDLRPDVVLMDVRMPRMDGLAATAELRRDGPEPAIIVLTTFDTDENLLGALRLGANGFLLKDIAPTEILNAVRRAAAGESILAPAVVPRLIEYAIARSSGDPHGDDRRGDDRRGDSADNAGGDRAAGGAAAERHRDRAAYGGAASELSRDWAAGGSAADRERAADSAAVRRERAAAILRRLSAREREVAEAVATGRSNAEISVDLHMSVPTVKAYVSRVLDKVGCANRVQIAILIHEAR